MNEIRIYPIGKIENKEESVCVKLDPKYAEGLKGLDGYSHVQILWWADGCDNAKGRDILTEKKPYNKGPDEIGVFALRSPERPNPIRALKKARFTQRNRLAFSNRKELSETGRKRKGFRTFSPELPIQFFSYLPQLP